MLKELKRYLLIHGVASSRTTSYNPRGNGQCEHYNDIVPNKNEISVETEHDSFKENEIIILPGTTDKVVDRCVDNVEIVHDLLDVIQEYGSLLRGNQVVRRSGRMRKVPTRLDL